MKDINRGQGKLNTNVMDEDRKEFTDHETGNRFGLPDDSSVKQLPSRLQPDQVARLQFFQEMEPLTCTIRTVHFTKSKVKYDVDIWLPGKTSTRVYNVDSVFLVAL